MELPTQMELPTPYIFTLESPIITFKGRLYQPGIETLRDDNYFDTGNAKYELNEISKPIELEELYYTHEKETLEQFKREFSNQRLNSTYMSNEEIQRQLGDNSTLKLLITEILPVITSIRVDNQINAALNDQSYEKSSELEELIQNINTNSRTNRRNTSSNSSNSNNSHNAERAKEELIRQVNREYNNLVRRPTENRLEGQILTVLENNSETREAMTIFNDNSIYNTELTGGSNFLRLEDSVYELVTTSKLMEEFRSNIDQHYYQQLTQIPATKDPLEVLQYVRENYQYVRHAVKSRIRNKLKSTKVKIGEQYLIPLFVEETSYMLDDYKKLTEKKLKIDAINHEEFQAQTIARIQEEEEQLEKLINTNKYEINGAGFEKRSGEYYAYITTPEYILRSPHNNNYYKFPKAKVGVTIRASGRNSLTIGDPIVMNRYSHPFLSDSSSMQRLCMGNYSTSHARKLNPGQAVLTLLTKAHENLMMGYRTGSNPYKKLNNESFSNKKISEAQFRNSGLACLNDYRGS